MPQLARPLVVLVGAASMALLCGLLARRPRREPLPTLNFYDPDAL